MLKLILYYVEKNTYSKVYVEAACMHAHTVYRQHQVSMT